MARVVVMGGGIGGITQAYALKKALPGQHEVVPVSDSSRFELAPSNPWVAVGWRPQEKLMGATRLKESTR